MADMMTFPNTVEEFMEQYKITDTEQIYTNGTELVPIFRMKQWFDHKPEQQWTPCSERLPEKSGRYLVTNTRLGAFEVTWNIFYNGKGEAPEGWLYEDGTIAWMPLPEPYKGEES